MRSDLDAAVAFEWRKLRHRPALLVMTAILLVSIVLFSYLLPYAQYLNPRLATPGSVIHPSFFMPFQFLHTTIALIPTFSLIALITGALAAGSEYGYGTWKSIFTQGPSRTTSFLGGFLALCWIMLLLAVLTFITGAICALGFALAFGRGASDWPAALTIAQAIASTWLIFTTFAAFGVALAHFFRQAAAAIGAGIAYLIIVEGLIVHYLLGVNPILDNVLQQLPAVNSNSLVAAFAPNAIGNQALAASVNAVHAVFILALYVVIFLLASASLLRRRDVV